MSYRRVSPQPVVEGGTGAQTLTGVLIGNGTSAVTGNAVTQHDVLIGGASNAITSVAPSSTSGVALISGGAAADPSFGTVVVAGGGTGATTLTGILKGSGTSAITAVAVTQHDVLVGAASNSITSVAPSATAGVPLVSGGSSADPSFTTAVVAGGGTGQVSFTANAPIIAGTSSTAALDQVTTDLNTAGYVLTANASGAPTFQAAAAGGITTIDGDSSSVTGSTITLTGGTSGAVFTGDGSTTITESFNYLALLSTTSANGQITINSVPVLHQQNGYSNIFLGDAGNFTLSGIQNVAVGYLAGAAITTGLNNVVVGQAALSSAQADSYQVAIGQGALNALNGSSFGNIAIGGNGSLTNLATGQFNISIGNYLNCNAYNGAESSNIILNNYNAVAGESNTLRIGQGTGTGNLNLNAAYIAGIAGITTTVDDGVPVLISSSTGQLGTASLSSGVVLTKSVTLLSTDIKALHATPIQILPAPASGHSNYITSIWARLNYGGTTPFVAAAGQTLQLYYQNTSGLSSAWTFPNSAIVATANTIFFSSTLPFVDSSNLGTVVGGMGGVATITEGLAIVIANTSATEITGDVANDSTITITVSYYVV